eukprot:scaffold105548_cov30-Prasinocladus_malaysianus.AAC.1
MSQEGSPQAGLCAICRAFLLLVAGFLTSRALLVGRRSAFNIKMTISCFLRVLEMQGTTVIA